MIPLYLCNIEKIKPMKKHLFTAVIAIILASCTPNSGQKTSSESAPEIEIVKHSVKSDQYATIIHVQVKNNTDKLVSYLDLKGVFYDGDGNIVGTGVGNGMNLPAGKTKTIDVLAADLQGASRYEVELGNVMYE